MKDNSERDIPYVSKELCVYLRERFSLQNVLHDFDFEDEMDGERALGGLIGVNIVLELLEEIQITQEERDGIRG